MTTTRKLKDSEVYRQVAAGYVRRGKFTREFPWGRGICLVLSSDFRRPDMSYEFNDLFVYGEGFAFIYQACDSDKESRDVRLLALCFMAAIAEAEGR